jgi:uncharacterized alpha-E superfamily protein
MTPTLRWATAGCLVTLLAGCEALEPYQRPYSWHPTGANVANLAAMVADPHDLLHGRGAAVTDGTTAAAAIDRLHHDHVKPLLDVGNATPSASATPGTSN